jgi:hypothetical protein
MTRTDDIRNDVMARIDRTNRNYRAAFFGAVALEGLCLMTFLFATDFTDRTQVLLLLATVMMFSVLGLGLVALGAYINRATLRVLQAIDATRNSTRS